MINFVKEYPKIETVFRRDTEGTKKLILDDYRSLAVEYLKDCTWEGTEKIDGTNIGIIWDGHKVYFQGRTERADIPKHLLYKLEKLFGGITNEELFEQTFGEKRFILYGEGYGNKIQKAGSEYIPNDVSFILFDIYAIDSEIWLSRANVEEIAHTFNVDVVPIVFEGSIKEAIDYVKLQPNSTIGTAKMEGLVCRPKVNLYDHNGNRLIVKIKVCDFC